MPSFETRYPHVLESVLAIPQKQYDGKLLHQTLEEQAAILFYEMIKQHPFVNGNKRMACVSLMTFLTLNGKWMGTSWKSLYDIAVSVASSPTANREGVLNLLTSFLTSKIVDMNA